VRFIPSITFHVLIYTTIRQSQKHGFTDQMSHSPLRKTAVQLEKLPRHFQCHRRMCEACQEHSYCGCGGWSVIQSWTEPQCSIAQLVVEAEHQRKVADDIGDTQFILAASQTP
jgi:hypothetical protein